MIGAFLNKYLFENFYILGVLLTFGVTAGIILVAFDAAAGIIVLAYN